MINMLCRMCSSRKRILVGFIIFLISLLTITSVMMEYDLREHKWTYMYIQELPYRHESPDARREQSVSHHAWQPGPEYTLVDVVEPYLKSHHDGHTLPTRNFYQVLHYNEEANNHAPADNAIIQSTCAYRNCFFTNNRTLFRNSSAVIFSLSHGKTKMEHELPRKVPGQVWVFYDREPPVVNGKFFYRHHSWRNAMNWSMSYRLDSDIVHPYGTFRSRGPGEIPTKDYSAIYRKKTKFAFWLVSNCNSMVFSGRNEYVNALKKYIPIDIYGACGTPVGDDINDLFAEYKFYLSFENSFCKGYVTEKFFGRFSEDVVLVVRGGVEYDQLFPSDAFVSAGNYMNAASLAQALIKLNQSETLYTAYLRRKDKYVFNGMMNWQCQMCAKLNNQELHQNLYENIVTYWNANVCWKPGDFQATLWKYYAAVVTLVCVISLVTCALFRYRRVSGRLGQY